ncbi:MmcQ/YjbR family DNA-binding protein [Paenibacillus sinopodophylli]|uniref:MmcQ/YjbR family DNA-binding protein n=1 Tax=Paenibacillus sinopodophylli TaxID=1837342 RepID=UPI001FE3EACE|nr:MmcQ/YjbR family DNA-binding protein [Paenibacillus sinopodophylli]
MEQDENEHFFDYSEILDRVRALCLSFPGTSERISHGAPTFFVAEKKSFVQFHNNHHNDGKVALWCAAPEGMQAQLIESDSAVYFRPGYVGHLGWIGVRLDRDAEWHDLVGVIQDAYLTKAPKKLLVDLKRSLGYFLKE